LRSGPVAGRWRGERVAAAGLVGVWEAGDRGGGGGVCDD